MSYTIIDRHVFGPRHAKPRNAFKIAAKGSAIAALLAATGFAGAGMAAMTPAPSPAAFAGQSATAVLTASVKLTPNWTEQTCHALEAWQRQPGDDRLERLVLDAAQLPKSYLKTDVFEVAADASSPSKNAAQYLSVAEQYAGEDCWGGA